MLHKGTSVTFQELQLLRERQQLGLNVSSLDSCLDSATEVCVTFGKFGHCVECQFYSLEHGGNKNQPQRAVVKTK